MSAGEVRFVLQSKGPAWLDDRMRVRLRVALAGVPDDDCDRVTLRLSARN